MKAKKKIQFCTNLLIIFLVSLIFSACSPTNLITDTPSPSVTVAPVETMNTIDTPPVDDSLQITMDNAGVVSGYQLETVAAVPATSNPPYWELLPEYTLVTLQDYPITSSSMKPHIYIYPVKDLTEVNIGAGEVVAKLQTLIQSPQEIEDMPFLPLVNSAQMMYSRIQYIDFKNGQGLRYLAWFSQGIVPVNNFELIYTYQGLTRDGKYYIAAVLPVNNTSLPENGNITGKEPAEFSSDYNAYLMTTVNMLYQHPADSFFPDLVQLDALMSSLEVMD